MNHTVVYLKLTLCKSPMPNHKNKNHLKVSGTLVLTLLFPTCITDLIQWDQTMPLQWCFEKSQLHDWTSHQKFVMIL